MTQDTYRFAFEEANAELQEIAGQFENLRVRKEQVEQVIEVLRPLLGDASETESVTVQQTADPAPFLVQQSVVEAVPEPALEAEFLGAADADVPRQRHVLDIAGEELRVGVGELRGIEG